MGCRAATPVSTNLSSREFCFGAGCGDTGRVARRGPVLPDEAAEPVGLDCGMPLSPWAPFSVGETMPLMLDDKGAKSPLALVPGDVSEGNKILPPSAAMPPALVPETPIDVAEAPKLQDPLGSTGEDVSTPNVKSASLRRK